MEDNKENFDNRKSYIPMIHIPLGFGRPLVEALFLARPNRFLIEAELDGRLVLAHLADRGRLKETLFPGVRLLLAHNDAPGRKTQFQAVAALQTVAGVEQLTSLDTHLPNRLIEAALRAQALAPFAAFPHVRREVTIGASRFDFQVSDGVSRCVIEVKSAGFVADSVASFPDAPTVRGRRHLAELAVLAQAGERVAALFVAQGACSAVTMNTAIDPDFAATLRQVAGAGVEVYAYACPLRREGITLGERVPIFVDGDAVGN